MNEFLQTSLEQLRAAAEPLRIWTRSDTFFRDVVLIALGVVVGFILNELSDRREVR